MCKMKRCSNFFWTAVSRTVNAHRNRVNKQKKKRRSLRIDASSIGDKFKKIKRGLQSTWNWCRSENKCQISYCIRIWLFFFCISDDTAALIVSVKTAASDANATVSSVKERLRNISEEVGRITLTNISVNINDMLTDADQAGKCWMVCNSHLHFTPHSPDLPLKFLKHILAVKIQSFKGFMCCYFICLSKKLLQSTPCDEWQARRSQGSW